MAWMIPCDGAMPSGQVEGQQVSRFSSKWSHALWLSIRTYICVAHSVVVSFPSHFWIVINKIWQNTSPQNGLTFNESMYKHLCMYIYSKYVYYDSASSLDRSIEEVKIWFSNLCEWNAIMEELKLTLSQSSRLSEECRFNKCILYAFS